MDAKNMRKPWTKKEIDRLEVLAGQNTPTRIIALKLGRSPSAIYSEARKEHISLKPTNQSPYNRRKSRPSSARS